MKLADLTWPEVASLNRNIIVLYPIAALEQHSRHLPFFTDSILCEAVATRVEAALPKHVLLLPVQWLGASAHHLGIAGSLSAENETHIKVIAEPLRCLLRQGFTRQFVLNGHGGNIDSYHLALRQLLTEFPNAELCGASYWDLATEEIGKILEGPQKTVGHACEFETSMMQAIRPDLVRANEIQNDLRATERPDALRKVFIPHDMKQRTDHGGVGYAEFATADKGLALLDVVVERVVKAINAMRRGLHKNSGTPAKRNARSRS